MSSQTSNVQPQLWAAQSQNHPVAFVTSEPLAPTTTGQLWNGENSTSACCQGFFHMDSHSVQPRVTGT